MAKATLTIVSENAHFWMLKLVILNNIFTHFQSILILMLFLMGLFSQFYFQISHYQHTEMQFILYIKSLILPSCLD